VIVLDTNVLSELMRPSPASTVEAWIASHPASSLYISTITQGEILYGIGILPRGRRRTALEHAAEAMFEQDFADRILAFDSAAARSFASIGAERRRRGQAIGQLDAQIAGIARSRNAAIATRNSDDFDHCGIEVFDPWSD
jgi:hypothetical protein